jgi:hypothetical protein
MTTENLVLPALSNRPSTKISLMDLPDEIILTIAEILHKRTKDDSWFEPFDMMMDRDRVRTVRDALALSSCCKRTRRIIFQEWMVREIPVKLGNKQLAAFASMPENLRSRIQ